MAEYMNNMPDAALDWDSEVTNEQREFVLLPAGDYLFTVQSFERARYEGSAKLPPCSMAKPSRAAPLNNVSSLLVRFLSNLSRFCRY